jgi:S1-C subfamily serine protease
MSGPRHLWSGDWERESARAAEDLPSNAQTPDAVDEPPAPARRRRGPAGRPVAVGLAAFLLVVGVALAISSLGGSPARSPSTPPASQASASAGQGQLSPSTPGQIAQAPQQSTPTPTGVLKAVAWLGMQVVTVPGYGTVVETVQAQSPGDQAGLNPGDVILSINHRAIESVSEIAPAIANLHRGDVVQVLVERGSAEYATAVTLAAPPTPAP